jgi:exodeoxyribonuclease-1
MGFVFYDTETTGTDPAFDQILQFAAIHTDFALNELDRFEIRCQLLPYIVPAPGAMRVTRVPAARLFDPSLTSHYEMACRIRDRLVAWSPALFIGYNSLQFDEHLLRQAFYKSLHPPYLTNTNGNSRSDALRMVQAASLFAPDALVFPMDDDGEFVFKLDRVAPLNGFAHNHPHDAIADVEATIFLCRRLMERAPDLWSAFMRFSQKAAVCDHVVAEPAFCLSDFYFGDPYSWLVTVIGSNPDNSSEFYVYNLEIDPASLAELSEEDLAQRFDTSPKPVRRLKANACPIIMPLENAPTIARAAQLGSDELTRRVQFLGDNARIRERLIGAFQSTREQPLPSPHLERQLYDGFFPKEDEILAQQFHAVPWDQRPAIIATFKDRRLKKIGQRLIYSERPDLLAEVDRALYERAIASRIGRDDGETLWLTLPQAIANLDDLLVDADPEHVAFLQEHRVHLAERMARAALALKQDEAEPHAAGLTFATPSSL